MADVVRRRPGQKPFWSKYAKKDPVEDPESAYIPGVSTGNARRPTRVQVKKPKEIKATIPIRQPHVESLTPSIKSSTSYCEVTDSTDDLSEISRPSNLRANKSREVTLKDLSAEDKKRIANLIKELAKVGDEKEKAVDELHNERKEFEKQVLQLVEQQEKILNEREEIQNQLFSCQDLLAKYQDKIKQKQKELNDSVHEQHGQEPDNKGMRHKRQSPKPTSQPYLEEEDEERERGQQPQNGMYTSLIDEEIAHRRGTNNHMTQNAPSTIADDASDIGSARGSVNQWRAPYLDKVPTLKAFRNPVMSSTQKSFDGNALAHSQEGSFHEMKKSPRSSVEITPRVSSQNSDKGSKVGFKENMELGYDEAKLFSPNMPGGVTAGVFGDKSYMSYYKKLSQTDRKRELLRQRQSLLDEQQRLRNILKQQEEELRNKRAMLDQQQARHRERVDRIENHSEKSCDTEDKENVFGKEVQRLDFDAKVKELEGPVDRIYVTARCQSPSAVRDRLPLSVMKQSVATSPIKVDQPRDNRSFQTPPKLRDAATSACHITNKLDVSNDNDIHGNSNHVDAATSMGHVADGVPKEDLDCSIEENGGRRRKVVDAATSVSQMNLTPRSRSPHSGADSIEDFLFARQGNLPIPVNRGRFPTSPRTPGDKTLSVVEIVNSLEETPSPAPGSRPQAFPSSPCDRPTGRGAALEDSEGEDEEESQILEDIFFMKG